MSVVAYKDGVMASDTGLFLDKVVMRYDKKLYKSDRTGFLYGFTGNLNLIQILRKWVIDSEKNEDKPEFDNEFSYEMMVVKPTGKIIVETQLGINEIYDDVCVIGSPYEMAMGALLAGASAKEAVKICINHHTDAEGKVKTIKF